MFRNVSTKILVIQILERRWGYFGYKKQKIDLHSLEQKKIVFDGKAKNLRWNIHRGEAKINNKRSIKIIKKTGHNSD